MKRSRCAALIALAVVIGGCRDVTAPRSRGALRVTIATSGLDVDLDGYSLRFDAGSSRPMATNDVLIVADMKPGPVVTTLEGVASNCTVDAVYPQPVDVVADDTTDVGISVSCTSSFTAVTVGFLYACGLTVRRAIYCWGFNGYGQLGTGAGTAMQACFDNHPCSSVPIAVAGGQTFTEVSAGFRHVCALAVGGAAYCWGWNAFGQLGDGTTTDRIGPVAVLGGLTFSTVRVGSGHTCGITTAGATYCWGRNLSGELGDSTATNQKSPTRVHGELAFSEVSAGYGYTCAVTTDHAAYCWGHNGGGQLGDGSTTHRVTPVAVQGELSFRTVSVGGDHSCGVTTGGTGYCWGGNRNGQLGDGTTTSRASPVASSGGRELLSTTAGGGHSCGVTVEHLAYCWGWNYSGQLGDNSRDDRLTPTAVAGGHRFATVSAGGGGSHTCGVTTAGAAYCWGDNSYGELGIGKIYLGYTVPESFSRVPVMVEGQP